MANADNTTNPAATKPARWTERSIRKATLLPKPRGEIERFNASIETRDDLLTKVLQHIASHADVLDDGRRLASVNFQHAGRWLLVPASDEVLDALAMFGAERADLESTDDAELGCDDEPELGAIESTLDFFGPDFNQSVTWATNERQQWLSDMGLCELDGSDDEPSTDVETHTVLEFNQASGCEDRPSEQPMVRAHQATE